MEQSVFKWGMFGLLAAAIVALNFVLVPFHAADDENHFALAYAFAHFQVGPTASPRSDLSSGGYVDAAIPKVIARNALWVRLVKRPPHPVIGNTAWTGRTVFMELPDTVYVPILFAPQAIAIRVSETAGLTVEQTIYAARVANGLSAFSAVALAIIYLPEGISGILLCILSLPKSLVLLSSNSIDPLMFGLTAILLAFYCRAISTDWKPRAWHYALAALAVVAIGGARPPLTALGLVVCHVAARHRNRQGTLWGAISIAVPLAWWATVLPLLRDTRCPPSGPLGQKLSLLVEHGPHLLGHTFAERGVYYLFTFIGEVGYGRGLQGRFHPLPLWIYPLALGMLLLALVLAGSQKPRLGQLDRAVPSIVALAIVVGLFFSFSIACNAAGTSIIEGIQGRYFVSPILAVGVTLAAWLPQLARIQVFYRVALPLFLVSSATLVFSQALNSFWK